MLGYVNYNVLTPSSDSASKYKNLGYTFKENYKILQRLNICLIKVKIRKRYINRQIWAYVSFLFHT